tara:strand:- start:1023 stop:1640 length:618 start_codon:yes stop_codon:yes gene_type:complete
MKFAAENPVVQEILLAGIRPLPINRMMRQAGREVNDFTKGKGYGPFIRRSPARNAPRTKISQEQLDQRLMSDPAFRAAYERQVERGLRPNMEDPVEIDSYAFSPDQYNIRERPVDLDRSGQPSRRYRSGGLIPEDVKQRVIERLLRTQDVINNWDPIEASAIEDLNRLRGGRRGPALPDAAGFVMDLETIPTPSNPDGVRLFEGV